MNPSSTEIYTLSLHDALPISMHDSLFTTGTFPTKVRAAAALHSGMLTLVGGLEFRVKQGVVGSDPQLASVGAEILPLGRSEEHTSELQSHVNLVCRLLLEKKK